MNARSALVVLGVLAMSCGAARSYPLNVPASSARGYFAPLGTCASQKGLKYVEHPDSVNVQFDGQIWIQYMIQGPAFRMVLAMDQSVTDEARIGAAKAKGDEIYSCALSLGPTEVPSAPAPAPAEGETAPPAATTAPTEASTPPATTTTPPAPTGIVSKAKTVPELPAEVCPPSKHKCNSLADCVGVFAGAGARCINGYCYKTESPGCPCTTNTDCGYGFHCGKGVCYPHKVGAPCSGEHQGECGLGLHCGGGLCVPNESGYACNGPGDCGIGSHCVDGVCN